MEGYYKNQLLIVKDFNLLMFNLISDNKINKNKPIYVNLFIQII